jgi:hypothetical protein
MSTRGDGPRCWLFRLLLFLFCDSGPEAAVSFAGEQTKFVTNGQVPDRRKGIPGKTAAVEATGVQ